VKECVKGRTETHSSVHCRCWWPPREDEKTKEEAEKKSCHYTQTTKTINPNSLTRNTSFIIVKSYHHLLLTVDVLSPSCT